MPAAKCQLSFSQDKQAQVAVTLQTFGCKEALLEFALDEPTEQEPGVVVNVDQFKNLSAFFARGS